LGSVDKKKKETKKKLTLSFRKDSKDIYNVKKDKCCSSELSIHQRILKKMTTISPKINCFPQ